MSIEQRLAEIEARCAAATVGPWRGERVDYHVHINLSGPDDESIGVIHRWEAEPEAVLAESDGNADFVISSRADVPALVAALRVAVEGIKYAQKNCPGNRNTPYFRGVMARIEEALNGKP